MTSLAPRISFNFFISFLGPTMVDVPESISTEHPPKQKVDSFVPIYIYYTHAHTHTHTYTHTHTKKKISE